MAIAPISMILLQTRVRINRSVLYFGRRTCHHPTKIWRK